MEERADKLKEIFRNARQVDQSRQSDFDFLEAAFTVLIEEVRTVAKPEAFRQSRGPAALIDRKKLSVLLGISERSISDLQNDGMPCLRFGRCVKFDYEKVLEWAAKRPERRRGTSKLRVVG